MRVVARESRFVRPLIICLELAGAAAPVASAELLPTTLECGGGLFAANNDDEDVEGRPSNNVSGIDCEKSGANGWDCVAVADEKLSIERFGLAPNSDGSWSCTPGEEFEPSSDFACLGTTDSAERDFEGVSFDNGMLVATGSWGMSRKKGELRPRNWTLYRRNLNDQAAACEGRSRDELKSFVASLSRPDLDWAVDRTLQCGGLNIEGFANISGTYYFGLRSPSKSEAGIGYIVQAPGSALFPGSGAQGEAIVREIAFVGEDGKPIVGIGIRGLDALGDKLVIATGDAGVSAKAAAIEVSKGPEFGCPDLIGSDSSYPNKEMELAPMIWLWSPGDAAATLLGTGGGPYAKAKVEGITIVSGPDGKVDAILAIDSPAGEQGQLAVIKSLAVP